MLFCFYLIFKDEADFVFFFSSRRRHTRSKRDWSSDVCSSDLDGPIQQLAHGVRRVRGDTEAQGRSGEGAKAVEGSPQFLHTRGALPGVGAEDLLIVDPTPPEARERLERRAGTPRVRDARDARSPGVAHAPFRRAGELVGGRGVL